MSGIGIVGSGIAALHLGLFLQRRGIPVTVYSDRTPAEIWDGRLPNVVSRFGVTRERERVLGVDHWDFPDFGVFGVHFRFNSQPPLAFYGAFARPTSFVDMRIYLATLLEDFASRGGQVKVGALGAADVVGLGGAHDLLIVASGRGGLAELFPLVPERSPYDRPQRRLCGGLYRGIAYPEPLGLTFAISPGHGEVFHGPYYTFEGRVSSLLFEGIPGRGFEAIMAMRYDDDPKRFETAVLSILREHAPSIYARVDHKEFGLTRPLDLMQGAITPAVRRGYAHLADGRYALALGDAHVVNDPLLGQGANAASRAAWALGEAILDGGPFDEAFCRRAEERLWAEMRAATEWTNAALQPPPPHVLGIFAAASRSQAIANELVNNFSTPERNWEVVATPEGTAAFLGRFGVSGPERAELVV